MFGVTTKQERVLPTTRLGIQSFYGSNNTTEFHSTQRILGRFQELPRHPYLTEYVYATSTPLQQIILVQSIYEERLVDFEPTIERITEFTMQIVIALSFLNDLGIVCGNLSADTVQVSKSTVKIANWGLFSMTFQGKDVDFPIINPRFLSPESITGIFYKQDVWSLGVLLLDWVMGRVNSQYDITTIFDQLEQLNDLTTEVIPILLKDFIRDCLMMDHKARPQIQDLLLHGFLAEVHFPILWKKTCYIPQIDQINFSHFMPTYKQLFELWKLEGNDLEKECGSTSHKPAIFTIPIVVKADDDVHELVFELQGRPPFDDRIKPINLSNVFSKIKSLANDMNLSSFAMGAYKDEWKCQIDWNQENLEALWKSYEYRPNLLHAVEKEGDFNYQFIRWCKFTDLLQSFPHSRAEIRHEAITDIPPVSLFYIRC
jgi:serine/threonine protein kinase